MSSRSAITVVDRVEQYDDDIPVYLDEGFTPTQCEGTAVYTAIDKKAIRNFYWDKAAQCMAKGDVAEAERYLGDWQQLRERILPAAVLERINA